MIYPDLVRNVRFEASLNELPILFFLIKLIFQCIFPGKHNKVSWKNVGGGYKDVEAKSSFKRICFILLIEYFSYKIEKLELVNERVQGLISNSEFKTMVTL